MPKLAVEITDAYESITRPVVLAVSKTIVDRLSLPAGTKVQYTGAIDTAIQPGSEVNAEVAPPAQFPFTSKAHITVTEEYIEDQVLSTAVFKKEHNVIFADSELDVYLKPVYAGTQMTISFRYRAPDRSSAERWRNELRRRASQGMAEQLHDFSYHYAVPKEFQVILAEIFDRREAVAGYGDDIATYLKEHFTDRMTGITTLTGTEGLMAISEYQIGVLGWFNFPAVPENPEFYGEGGAYQVGFDYTFQFDKVISVAMQYPIIVHNQLLDERFRPSEGPYTLEQHRRDPSWSRQLLDHYTSLYPGVETVGGVVYPNFDDWLPRQYPRYYLPLFTSLMGVDTEDPTLVLNLHDLGEFMIAPNILHFLGKEVPYLLQRRNSFFHVTLYEGDMELGPEALTLSSDLELRTVEPMNPRKVYHFQLSLATNPVILSPGAKDRLRKDPPACNDVVDTLEKGSKSENDPGGYHTKPGVEPGYSQDEGSASDKLITIGGGKVVTEDSLDDVFDDITTQNPTIPNQYNDAPLLTMRTVMNAGVLVHNTSPNYADYQAYAATHQYTAGNTTDYRGRAPGYRSGYEGGTSVDASTVRGGVTMVDDLLSAGSRQ